ncbi:hypothetical protein DUI87_23255 [Hirundo rustica rustica]|uniref:Uncharacterized protein n=1 Tax=Hirundo rustica rustica TaxID=333673 RepID=A0A3M0JHK4_HIRRU|nr:hypothetical protein DUI87_23255 [Hirundo rustica rustica]
MLFDFVPSDRMNHHTRKTTLVMEDLQQLSRGYVPGRTLPVTQQINGQRPKSLLPRINMMLEYNTEVGIAYSFQGPKKKNKKTSRAGLCSGTVKVVFCSRWNIWNKSVFGEGVVKQQKTGLQESNKGHGIAAVFDILVTSDPEVQFVFGSIGITIRFQ